MFCVFSYFSGLQSNALQINVVKLCKFYKKLKMMLKIVGWLWFHDMHLSQ